MDSDERDPYSLTVEYRCEDRPAVALRLAWDWDNKPDEDKLPMVAADLTNKIIGISQNFEEPKGG